MKTGRLFYMIFGNNTRKLAIMDLKRSYLSGVLFISVFSLQGAVLADAAAESNYASVERREAAVGHYSRARALLVEALREFEAGRKIARPDMLLDSEEWRISVVSRTEELNRVLDPKPRVSKSGVYFSANPLLLRREKERLPAPADEAKQGNAYAEQDFQKRSKPARGRLSANVSNDSLSPVEAVEPATTQYQEPIIPELDQVVGGVDLTNNPATPSDVEQLRTDAETVVEERIRIQGGSTSEKAISSSDLAIDEKSAKQFRGNERIDTTEVDSDEEIAAAFEEAIKARMEKLAEPQK